jgi:hypothetical protein
LGASARGDEAAGAWEAVLARTVPQAATTPSAQDKTAAIRARLVAFVLIPGGRREARI